MVAGTLYGVVLSDRYERATLGQGLADKPYGALPVAPIVYIKPALCVTDGRVPMPDDDDGPVDIASTLALLFARDAAQVGAAEAMACVGAACLALDVSLPQATYYRPAIVQKCRDGFLPLGAFAAPTIPASITTYVDDRVAHSWSLDRLLRPVPELIADLSAFMTLRAGDVLLVGLPGDPPRVRGGIGVRVEADGLPTLHARLECRV